jgi:uncharacterized protein (DUF433 family)
MNWKDHITADAAILGGKPIIINTRLSVAFILQRLADGLAEEMLLNNYSIRSQEALKAVFAYAHDSLKDGLLYNKNLVA